MAGVANQQQMKSEMGKFGRPSALRMSPAEVDPMLSAGQGGKPALLKFLQESYIDQPNAEPPGENNGQKNILGLFGQIMNEAGRGGF